MPGAGTTGDEKDRRRRSPAATRAEAREVGGPWCREPAGEDDFSQQEDDRGGRAVARCFEYIV